MSQTQKISRNNTRVSKTDAKGGWSVTLHSTTILQYWPEDRKIRVCTGGWYTPTTRTRLTQAFHEWNLPFRIRFSQRDGRNVELYDPATGQTVERYEFSRDHVLYATY